MSRQQIITKIVRSYPNQTEESVDRLVRRRKKIANKYFIVKQIDDNRECFDIKKFDEHNTILLTYYQYILKEVFSIRMPNRNRIINELLDISPYIDKYREQTIYKFDLKSFYKSIDISKLLKKISQNRYIYPNEINFFVDTFSSLGNLYPGIGIINYMIEALGQDFDIRVKNLFKSNLIFYSRYVDDCIIILDRHIEEQELDDMFTSEIKEIFGENAKFNREKSCFINLSETKSFDYLGYLFNYDVQMKQNGNKKVTFSFGIAPSKIKKEEERLRKIIRAYKTNLNMKLLLIRIDLYYKRFVFLNNKKGIKKVWEVRGISQTYSEVKKLLEWNNVQKKYISGYITQETYSFLKGEKFEEFFREFGLEYPKEIENRVKNGMYLSNLALNKAVILHPMVGYDYRKLYSIMKNLDFRIDTSMSYKELAKSFKKNIYNL